MHYATFVISRDDDPETAVASALRPFDEALEVKPYRRYLDASDIQHIAAHYGLAPTDLPGLARKMQDWWGCEVAVDLAVEEHE
jgi:hypothetical protein